MKFMAFEWRGYERLGWLQDDGKTILAVNRDSRGMPQSVLDVIKRGPYARHQIKNAKDLESFNLDEVGTLPPLVPIATFCVSANSSDPQEAKRLAEAEQPTIYIRSPRNHVSHGEPVDIPLRSKTLECEGKLAIIMGKGGRYIAPEHALRHVFGYSIYNEGSVKEYQRHSSQFGLGQMFDLSSGFGPHIVTEDEFGDPYEHRLETRIDGEPMHSVSLSQMRHRIEEVIVYISSAITMFPGDVICMGVSAGECLKPERLVQKGERVDTFVSGIGTLSNPVQAEPTEPRTVGCC